MILIANLTIKIHWKPYQTAAVGRTLKHHYKDKRINVIVDKALANYPTELRTFLEASGLSSLWT